MLQQRRQNERVLFQVSKPESRQLGRIVVLAVGVQNVVFMSERTGAGAGAGVDNFGRIVRIELIGVVVDVQAAATAISTTIATSRGGAD